MAAGDSGMGGCKLHANISCLAAEALSSDLVIEILRCLPSKSLMRFKCVCKSWRALIISRYFCSLWRQHHQGQGIIFKSLIQNGQHRYVPLSGPAAGLIEFELPCDVHHSIVQSCNGFLLHRKLDLHNYWVYNPATREVVVLPPLRVDACKIHARHCKCITEHPVLAFDEYSHGRVVALAKHQLRPKKHQLRHKRRFVYQVFVTVKQGPWRSSCKPFKAGRLCGGVYWNNFIVWSSRSRTLFYDVGREEMRACASPYSLNHESYWVSIINMPYHLESGGHLHFIQVKGSRLIIMEMNHDLSGWFVKYDIEFSQIASSLFRSICWDESDLNFRINYLVEERQGTTTLLVIRCHDNVVLYRIQDNESWKLCQWEFLSTSVIERFYHDEHAPTIHRFHEQ